MIAVIDYLGRFVFPAPVRHEKRLKAGDPLEITVEGRSVVLTPAVPRCIFCGSADELTAVRSRSVCADDLEGLRELARSGT